jgi:hypothetical protein
MFGGKFSGCHGTEVPPYHLFQLEEILWNFILFALNRINAIEYLFQIKGTFTITLSIIMFPTSVIRKILQVAVHLAKRFQRRIFLEIDKPKTRIAYGNHVR